MRKVLDQRRSKRNVRRLQEQRQILPSRDRALPWMLLAHIAFFVLTPLEVVLLDRPFLPALGIPMIGLFLLATLLRWWATSLLKEQWNSKVVVPEDLQPVTSGPYRVVRHPNYLAVSLELLAAGLMYSAYLSTAVVGLLNLYATVKRIRRRRRSCSRSRPTGPLWRARHASSLESFERGVRSAFRRGHLEGYERLQIDN